MTKFNGLRVKKMQIISIAKFITETKCTVREAAKRFNISKTTLHRYMVKELPKHSIILARMVNKILNINKMERHIRGGLATKFKFANLKKLK